MTYFAFVGGLGWWETTILVGLLVIYVGTVLNVAFSKFQNGSHQLLWLLIVLFAPFLGTIIYFSIGGRYKLQ